MLLPVIICKREASSSLLPSEDRRPLVPIAKTEDTADGPAGQGHRRLTTVPATAARCSEKFEPLPPDPATVLLITPHSTCSFISTMAKSSSNNKKRKSAPQPTAKSTAPAKKASTAGGAAAAVTQPTASAADQDADDGLIGGSFYPEELEAAIEVLRALAAQPELMKAGKGGGGLIKSFKGAMWDCWRALGEVSGTGRSFRVR